MKKNYIFLLLIFTTFVQAQNPITVNITGSCQPVAGIYFYNSIVNTKNDYTRTATLNGVTSVVHVGFDGIKWVLYQGSLSSAGFFNLTVPAGVEPPATGWQVNPPNGCLDGTMNISTNLSLQIFSKRNFKIFPNPASNHITVSSVGGSFNYEIIDLNGRIIANGSNSETIDVSGFISGIYFLKIDSEILKFIKI